MWGGVGGCVCVGCLVYLPGYFGEEVEFDLMTFDLLSTFLKSPESP